MAARLHMNEAMLAWAGSAVRVEEAFPGAAEQEEYILHTDAEGFHKHISADTRLQLYYHDPNNGQRQVYARAVEVGEFEIIVEAEKRVPVGAVVALSTAKCGFVVVPPSSICNPKGLTTGSACVCWILTLANFEPAVAPDTPERERW